MGRKTLWTDNLLASAKVLLKSGLQCRQVDARLGLNEGATYAKLCRLKMTPAQREAERQYHRNYKKTTQANGRGHAYGGSGPPARVPEDVLAERDRRRDLSLARDDLTSEFFDDPLPGYSALDQMRERQQR